MEKSYYNIVDPSRRMLMAVRVYLLWYRWVVVVPACDRKDQFLERQPRKTAQSTGLIW